MRAHSRSWYVILNPIPKFLNGLWFERVHSPPTPAPPPPFKGLRVSSSSFEFSCQGFGSYGIGVYRGSGVSLYGVTEGRKMEGTSYVSVGLGVRV